jgi:hypothetical protein
MNDSPRTHEQTEAEIKQKLKLKQKRFSPTGRAASE